MKQTPAELAAQLRALRTSEIHGTITMSPQLRDAAARALDGMPVVEPVVVVTPAPAPATRTPVRKVPTKKK